ncbi:MAG TPA: hypothetical protein VHW09_31860 [Bryobacteraceae bacterium]|jgi:hypothetical protein|nr:hypothetical protein [Bryobacteraceae bacterium]
MSKHFIGIFALLALAALPALANPNFTGDWKLNPTKSAFGDFPAPDSMSIKVDHAEPKLTTVSKQSGQMGDVEMHATYTTDGKECTNEGFQGAPMKSVVKWDGDTLGIDTKGQFGDTDFTMTQKWTLSADGKTLTVAQHIASAMGEVEQKLVFDKQ